MKRRCIALVLASVSSVSAYTQSIGVRRELSSSAAATHHHHPTLRHSRNLRHFSSCRRRIGGREPLLQSLSSSNGDSFTPKTQTVIQSLTYFLRFVVQTIQSRRVIEERQDGHEPEPPKLGIRASFRKLNDSRKSLIRLVGYDSSLLVPAFSFLVLGAFMSSVIPHYYSSCISCVAAGEPSREKIVMAIAGLGITTLLEAIFTGCRGALFWIAGTRANYNVRVKLHRNLLLQEAAFFDETETGFLLSRLNNDVNKIGMVISFHVNIVLRQLAQFIFGSAFLLRIQPKLALVAFGGIGVVAWISKVYGEFARVLAERLQELFAKSSAVAETSFSLSETVRAFDGVSIESDRYESSQYDALQLEEVQAWAYGSHKFVSDAVQAALQCLLLFSCWTLGRAGSIPAARLTSFLFYTNYVLESSNEVGDQWAKIQSAIGASTNVFDLIRRIPKVRDPLEVTNTLREVNAAQNLINGANDHRPVIKFSDLTVAYGTMEKPALKKVNLDISRGDKVAIVGRSGSGKSSMLRTVLRFYDPLAGNCTLDGVDLKAMKRSDLASKVVVVEQEPHLFPMSLMDNVLYGIEMDAVDESTGEKSYSDKFRVAVSEALSLAGLSVTGEDNQLGLELDTRVGEGGRTLSGGQRQRVAIARSLVRYPDVLLLDEPTAALDSQSEKVVVEALKSAMSKTRCMLMVTHRLGVIRSLGINKVVVLDRGKIVEVGDPEELLRKADGLYSQLALEQGILPSSTNVSLSPA